MNYCILENAHGHEYNCLCEIDEKEILKYCCVGRPPTEKFHIVSNDNGCRQNCNFSVLDRKYAFWVNLVARIIQVCRIH